MSEGCKDLEELLKEEMLWLKEHLEEREPGIDRKKVIKQVKEYGRIFREYYCENSCLYQGSCDANKKNNLN